MSIDDLISHTGDNFNNKGNITMQNPMEVINYWLDAVNNSDIENLLSMYDEKAVLIPTFSNKILDSPLKIRDYFEKLSSNKDLSVTLHENTLRIQKITQEIFAICGIYLWRFAVENEPLSFEARFSFVLNLNLRGAVIQHHSSQIPRML